MYYVLWFNLLDSYADPQFVVHYLFPMSSLRMEDGSVLPYRTNIFKFYQAEKSTANYEYNYRQFPDPTYDWLYYNTTKPKHPSVIPGTYYFQTMIWRHQHPASCEDKKFVLIGDISYGSGIGNTLHNLATLLNFALTQDRILGYLGTQQEWIDKEWCHVNSFDCYFEPLTNCTFPQEELAKKDLDDDKYDSVRLTFFNQYQFYSNTTYWLVDFSNLINFGYYNTVPPIFQYFYDTHQIPSQDRYIHWRMQAVAFLARFNRRTLNWIHHYETKNCINCKSYYDVSMHIRHADKVLEMSLVSDEYYTYPLYFLENFMHSKLDVFVNGDDNNSITFMLANYTSDLSYFRSDIRKNEDVFKVLHYKHVTLKVLAAFKHQLYGHHTVGTFSSNWVRLIYEMKQTVGLHADGIFFEVGENTCISYAHCAQLHRHIRGN